MPAARRPKSRSSSVTAFLRWAGVGIRGYLSSSTEHEPADVTIERFDNASTTEPAEILAFYLTDSKDRPLIEMLTAK
ncbi:hypothetical protein ACFFWD_04025 [Bradyrhizobium erythrophlei]|uniref:hypothetical protein n=1 Tax=Bradyrhizobium erythrophlei TaxID=1437360 RepID=UPI0035EFB1DA